MRRLPVLLSVAAFYLSGCDFFSTREFRPKPSDIRVLPGLARAGDSVTFLATEAVWRAGAAAPEQILSKRRVTFAFGKDSLDGNDTLKVLAMRIREDSSGALVEESRRTVRSASDSDGFLALPTLLFEGWGESQSMGIFTVERAQSAVDTVDYGGHSEEAWVISESVLDGSRVVGSGRYWYGVSGLLRAEQSWDDFDWRGDNGEPARSQGGSAVAVSLRRSVARL